MRDNTYWNNNGKYQAQYDEMYAAVEDGKFIWTKASSDAFYHYYRFYNDGDTPTSYRYRSDAYAEVIEARVNERIEKEWKRFKKEVAA